MKSLVKLNCAMCMCTRVATDVSFLTSADADADADADVEIHIRADADADF